MNENNPVIIHDGKSIIFPRRLSQQEKSAKTIFIVLNQHADYYSQLLKDHGYNAVALSSESAVLNELNNSVKHPNLVLISPDLDGKNEQGLKLMQKMHEELRIPTYYILLDENNQIGKLNSDENSLITKALYDWSIDFLNKDHRIPRFGDLEFLLKVEKSFIDSNYRSLATFDYLTQVPVKRVLMENLEQYLKSWSRHLFTYLNNDTTENFAKIGELSLVLMDIDHFKSCNDDYGHLFGDEVLKQLATHYSKNLRANDTFARYGGEEFAIFLPEANFENAQNIYQRRAQTFREYIFQPQDGVEKNITTSAGIATLNFELYKENDALRSLGIERGKNIDVLMHMLIESADKGLYHAKNNGRNQCYEQNTLIDFLD